MISSASSPRVAIATFLIIMSTRYWMSCFTIVAVAISFALAWLRLMSGSVWPGAFLHASHNLFMQQVFTPLTSDTGITKYIAGDLGAALVVVALIVAYIFWRKRGELPGAGTVPAGAALASPR
jgi:membrane protease YdiL (CAAX protease family)